MGGRPWYIYLHEFTPIADIPPRQRLRYSSSDDDGDTRSCCQTACWTSPMLAYGTTYTDRWYLSTISSHLQKTTKTASVSTFISWPILLLLITVFRLYAVLKKNAYMHGLARGLLARPVRPWTRAMNVHGPSTRVVPVAEWSSCMIVCVMLCIAVVGARDNLVNRMYCRWLSDFRQQHVTYRHIPPLMLYSTLHKLCLVLQRSLANMAFLTQDACLP